MVLTRTRKADLMKPSLSFRCSLVLGAALGALADSASKEDLQADGIEA
jgi:hypothetical protein